MDGNAPQQVETENAISFKTAKERAKSDPLYIDRIKVYPKKVSGRFRRLKWIALSTLLAVYYLLPWVRWDRGAGAPDQAVLVDMDGRRAYFFFIEIWPQEVFYLTGLLVLAAVGLFIATSLAGRVWCGYACPQTVWTDLFMWVERRIEGDRNARIKLDKQPFSGSKAARKTVKHGIWLGIAFLTGGAWILYFGDAPTVLADFFSGEASTTTYFFVGLFTATTYLLAGWAREQVCTYMCPWPRFQSAMFDEDTLIVTYEKWRGEPRGKHKTGDTWEGRGDCVDCNQCVAVCPTGIDIRDGVQLECIGCALCVDACNTVMAKVGRPANLITYDTERRQQAKAAGKSVLPYRLIRPRTILYAMLLTGVGLLMLGSLLTRGTQSINVLHDRAPLYVLLSNGDIRNGYTIRVLNKARTERRFRLTAEGIPGARLTSVGGQDTGGAVVLTAKPDATTTFRIFVRAPRNAVKEAETPLRFVLTELAGTEKTVRDTVFRGPIR
jgi:cytochrome c oxidase accessory protein FixG